MHSHGLSSLALANSSRAPAGAIPRLPEAWSRRSDLRDVKIATGSTDIRNFGYSPAGALTQLTFSMCLEPPRCSAEQELPKVYRDLRGPTPEEERPEVLLGNHLKIQSAILG